MEPALQQLKDIHLPPPIAMWPISPGWIVLFCLICVFASYLCFALYKHRKSKYSVKFAINRLKKLKDTLPNYVGNSKIAAEISTLIRRTALYYYRREMVAGLTGKAWLQFLNNSSASEVFSDEAGRLLTDVPYQKFDKIDLMPLFTSTEAWLVAISKKS